MAFEQNRGFKAGFWSPEPPTFQEAWPYLWETLGSTSTMCPKIEFILMIIAEWGSKPPQDRWSQEQKGSGNGLWVRQCLLLLPGVDPSL